VDRQEITEELEHPGARNLLDSATLLRLAYNGSDGFPRVIPIGFYWNGSQTEGINLMVTIELLVPSDSTLELR
jgi:nitroimidazol reductase NimA-like FMN-containing flavoprotein (pyridoxamine 5'-phosphate oxidase superfamily)